ncbi:hypothetical protein BKA67DRAFT_569211 [Truncatella angustata]|uniref:Uncharacterized protein n=1 Tax=Truncatella angustata TaxID=152316 RepID=A0A9P8UJ35_9PEZI|nr:uncharacterized protein BKA67DRAFT_569211 [Truncatella angustata]KAH6653333.1 hypothetical protein BKA67DRAFT_569211 [Truncatella angustata]
MEHWLGSPRFTSPLLGGDAPQTQLWKWSSRRESIAASRTSPATTDMSRRNVYWVPVKKRQVDSIIETHNAILKRQNIPKLDGPSTAGVIAAVVIFVLAIMGMMIFLIWRHSRYQKKMISLKLEAEEVTQASDAGREMVMHANRTLGLVHNHYRSGTIEDRTKPAEIQMIREVGDWDRLGTATSHRVVEDDDRSFRTAAASIRTHRDSAV